MSEPYLGEIRMFAGNYAPVGWALCNGQLLNIADNQALYSLLDTTYGGDGVSTFALPDLQGRIPIHPSPSYALGAKGGTETVQLTISQMPTHTHTPTATTSTGSILNPNGAVWAVNPIASLTNYSNGVGKTPIQMNTQTVASVGGNQPHENMMPSLTVSFIIALQGLYPTQG